MQDVIKLYYQAEGVVIMEVVVAMTAKDREVLKRYARDANLGTNPINCDTWVVDGDGEVYEAVKGKRLQAEGFIVNYSQAELVAMLPTTGFPWKELDYEQVE
jgi:hypothetical protein